VSADPNSSSPSSPQGARFDKPLVVAVGDPAGIGPEVSVRAALELAGELPIVLFGDAVQLEELCRRHGSELRLVDGAERNFAAGLHVLDTGRVAPETITLHAPSPEGGQAQLRTLERAAAFVRDGHGRALVTGPTSKAAIVRAGHRFVGQTEFLAGFSGLADDAVTMMFLGPSLRVALVTTHLAIAEAPRAITRPRVLRTVRHLAEVLVRLRPGRANRLAVTGLNPHAGEEGLFGREELDVVAPALVALSAEEPFRSGTVELAGLLPAEAAFRIAQRGDYEGVVAMIHDQATIASKLLDWGEAVNTTWGLPFVRTSVDHGVAYDAAKKGTAEIDGMRAALAMAVALTGPALGTD
jgi:4-hydroxythreonine-4-phosphate dehydrogenase